MSPPKRKHTDAPKHANGKSENHNATVAHGDGWQGIKISAVKFYNREAVSVVHLTESTTRKTGKHSNKKNKQISAPIACSQNAAKCQLSEKNELLSSQTHTLIETQFKTAA